MNKNDTDTPKNGDLWPKPARARSTVVSAVGTLFYRLTRAKKAAISREQQREANEAFGRAYDDLKNEIAEGPMEKLKMNEDEMRVSAGRLSQRLEDITRRIRARGNHETALSATYIHHVTTDELASLEGIGLAIGEWTTDDDDSTDDSA